jgi:hypothetical protein
LAKGGPARPGGLYEVNEDGTPELLDVGGRQFLMMGRQAGYVTPARRGGGGTGAGEGKVITNNFTYNVQSGVTKGEVVALLQMTRDATIAQMDAKLRRAGVM